MPTVAIVDDRHEPRESLRVIVSRHLPSGWWALDSAPLPNMSDYPAWIIENDVVALLIDERLQEQARDAEGHATYDGHDLVDDLRRKMPTLPIFIVTSYPQAGELDERLGKVEDIVKRDSFADRADDHVERVVRSAQRYLQTHEAELSDLGSRAQRIAEGTANAEDFGRAKAIQEKLGLAFAIDEIDSRSRWLNEIDRSLGELGELQAEIDDYLKDRKE